MGWWHYLFFEGYFPAHTLSRLRFCNDGFSGYHFTKQVTSTVKVDNLMRLQVRPCARPCHLGSLYILSLSSLPAPPGKKVFTAACSTTSNTVYGHFPRIAHELLRKVWGWNSFICRELDVLDLFSCFPGGLHESNGVRHRESVYCNQPHYLIRFSALVHLCRYSHCVFPILRDHP